MCIASAGGCLREPASAPKDCRRAAEVLCHSGLCCDAPVGTRRPPVACAVVHTEGLQEPQPSHGGLAAQGPTAQGPPTAYPCALEPWELCMTLKVPPVPRPPCLAAVRAAAAACNAAAVCGERPPGGAAGGAAEQAASHATAVGDGPGCIKQLSWKGRGDG